MRAGTGYAPCHHGEILQGVFLDESGAPCRGLVTLPMGEMGTRAEFTPDPAEPVVRLASTPADRHKALRAAGLAVRICARLTGRTACGGRLTLTGEVPVGLGMGSSTSDILAAVRAVSASFRVTLPPATIARLAVRAEGACDPLMLAEHPVLFAQRQGRVLEVLGGALPSMVVFGCTTGGGRPVETLALPAGEYGAREVDTFERLRVQLRCAVRTGDVELLGRVCTESARANQRLLAKDELGALETIARAAGGIGVQVAHSGNVAGVLFAPHVRDLRGRLRQCARALRAEGISTGRLFRTGTGAGISTGTGTGTGTGRDDGHVARRGARGARGRARRHVHACE